MKLRVLSAGVLIAMVAAGFSMSSSSSDATAKAAQSTPYTFQKVYESPELEVSIDWSTRTSMIDEDGDLLSAAIFKVIRKTSGPTEPRTYISAFTAICGYPAIVQLSTKAFSLDDKPMEPPAQQPVIEVKSFESGAGAAYLTLCADPPKPTPVDPRYTAPDRYKQFWV